ncbi:hypothetical protein MMC08_005201, partial [Hypocenomyce scalaris]|nr:hypothetical protein [Hypocenomyce scalaris]
MDGVSAAASLASLVQVALILPSFAKETYRGIDNAPTELFSVAQNFALVRPLLQDLLKLRPALGGGDEQLLPLDFRMSLAFALEQSADAIYKVGKACDYLNAK